MTKKAKTETPARREIDLDPEIAQELRDLWTMDIRSYWPACQQVADELNTHVRSVTAAAWEDTPQYNAMWGTGGRPKNRE